MGLRFATALSAGRRLTPTLAMHITRRAVLAVCFAPAMAGAGATGPGSFENDDAWDWVNDCTRSAGPKAIAAAFRTVSGSYVEAPEASAAIAAAEVVAAARGKPGPGFPGELRDWLERQTRAEIAGLAPVAVKVIERIANGPGSELQTLWKQSKHYDRWQRNMQDLLARLQ